MAVKQTLILGGRMQGKSLLMDIMALHRMLFEPVTPREILLHRLKKHYSG